MYIRLYTICICIVRTLCMRLSGIAVGLQSAQLNTSTSADTMWRALRGDPITTCPINRVMTLITRLDICPGVWDGGLRPKCVCSCRFWSFRVNVTPLTRLSLVLVSVSFSNWSGRLHVHMENVDIYICCGYIESSKAQHSDSTPPSSTCIENSIYTPLYVGCLFQYAIHGARKLRGMQRDVNIFSMLVVVRAALERMRVRPGCRWRDWLPLAGLVDWGELYTPHVAICPTHLLIRAQQEARAQWKCSASHHTKTVIHVLNYIHYTRESVVYAYISLVVWFTNSSNDESHIQQKQCLLHALCDLRTMREICDWYSLYQLFVFYMFTNKEFAVCPAPNQSATINPHKCVYFC